MIGKMIGTRDKPSMLRTTETFMTLSMSVAALCMTLVQTPASFAAPSASQNQASSATPDYVKHVLEHDRLIAHYRFDDVPTKTEADTDTGNAIDASGHGHDGTYVRNPVSIAGVESLGGDNRAVDLQGDGMIVIDNQAVNQKTMTLAGFFRSTDTTSIDQRIFTTAKKSRYQFSVLIDEGMLHIAIEAAGVPGAGATFDLAKNKWLDGKWHHLIVSRSGNNWNDIAVWVDFEPVTMTKSAWTSKGTLDDQAVIGARSKHPANAFHGALDEVSFFEGPFDQAQVDRMQDALAGSSD